ncbi:MAG: YkgJ family cysteine cluster protein [Gammaproteobacteria bacterium]|nr:YkgJ family cysteine cluster protein [Gammaproteobacteria bacterium]
MQCRPGCGACCIAPSISSPIPGLEAGKPAGFACVQLDEGFFCKLFGELSRPEVCVQFSAQKEWCGELRDEAIARLTELEAQTK